MLSSSLNAQEVKTGFGWVSRCGKAELNVNTGLSPLHKRSAGNRFGKAALTLLATNSPPPRRSPPLREANQDPSKENFPRKLRALSARPLQMQPHTAAPLAKAFR